MAEEGKELFQQLADHDGEIIQSALLFPNAQNRDLSVLGSNGKAYDFDHVSFAYKSLKNEPIAKECMSRVR